jgi:hypothetical protein
MLTSKAWKSGVIMSSTELIRDSIGSPQPVSKQHSLARRNSANNDLLSSFDITTARNKRQGQDWNFKDNRT